MSRTRLFLTGIVFFLLIGAGIAWILSNEGIIQTVWAPSLGITFSILGVLVAFIQWMLPLPSSDSKPDKISKKTSQARGTYLKQTYDRLNQGYGALIIYARANETGKNARINYLTTPNQWGHQQEGQGITANIVERLIDDCLLVAAVFPHIQPGDYRVRVPNRDYVDITVFPKQVAEVDWSRATKNSSRKDRSQKYGQFLYILRLSSVMIALGGIAYLAARYLIASYFNTVGSILIGFAAAMMFSAFVLDWLGWLHFDKKYPVSTSWTHHARFGLFIAEFGAVLFLFHRYMATPYADVAGIILMAIGGIWFVGAFLFN